MDFHGVWDRQAGSNSRPLTAPKKGVGGGVRVCVPFPKAVVWHTCGTVELCHKNGSS